MVEPVLHVAVFYEGTLLNHGEMDVFEESKAFGIRLPPLLHQCREHKLLARSRRSGPEVRQRLQQVRIRRVGFTEDRTQRLEKHCPPNIKPCAHDGDGTVLRHVSEKPLR